MNSNDYSNSVSLLLPTKGRYKALLDSLNSLSETEGAKYLLDVIILADQDEKSYEIANGFLRDHMFRSYKVVYSAKRLYPVKAFLFLYELCTSRYFCFMNDENSYKPNWLINALARFNADFLDKIGLLSLFKKKKAGLCLTSQDFVQYNEGEIYNPAYTLYYSDDELSMRAILLGRYSWLEDNGVFHDEEITKAVSAISWEEKIALKKVDRGIFYKRSETNFGLPEEKIYPWKGFREVNLPLKGEINGTSRNSKNLSSLEIKEKFLFTYMLEKGK